MSLLNYCSAYNLLTTDLGPEKELVLPQRS